MGMTHFDKTLWHILHSYYICDPLYPDILDYQDFRNYKILKDKVIRWI